MYFPMSPWERRFDRLLKVVDRILDVLDMLNW